MRAEQERLQALGVVDTSIAIDSDRVPWMQYIAHHNECDKIIGKGIVQFVAQFMPNVTDPNASGQLRLNFVATRCTGSSVVMHVGNKGKDAKIRVIEGGS